MINTVKAYKTPVKILASLFRAWPWPLRSHSFWLRYCNQGCSGVGTHGKALPHLFFSATPLM